MISLFFILVLVLTHSLALLTVIAAWLICIARLVRKARVPPLFWADLAIVTLLLIPGFARSSVSGHYWATPPHYLFGLALRFWLFEVLPAILALPAVSIYRQLPGYLLTSGAILQTLAVLLFQLLYRGGGIM